MKKISFTVNGQALKGTLFSPQKKNNKLPGVLFIHGWTSDETGYLPRAEAISKLGYICLTFSMRGHGEDAKNYDKYTGNDHLQDCVTAYEFLAAQDTVDPDQIHVVGASYGGYLGSLLSAKKQIKSLVLRAPAMYPAEKIHEPTAFVFGEDEHLHQFRLQHLSYNDNSALLAVHKFKNPIVIIESEADVLVPRETVQNYIAAADKKLINHIYIPGADHQLSKALWKQQFIDILVEWFKKQQ